MACGTPRPDVPHPGTVELRGFRVPPPPEADEYLAHAHLSARRLLLVGVRCSIATIDDCRRGVCCRVADVAVVLT